jgi:hypothetical protein
MPLVYLKYVEMDDLQFIFITTSMTFISSGGSILLPGTYLCYTSIK